MARIAVITVITACAATAMSPLAYGLSQPNGTVIPTPTVLCNSGQPGGLGAVMACACTAPNVCNIGAACPGGMVNCDPGKNSTCEETIWHSPNDNSCIPSNTSGIDLQAAAKTTPETYHPTCPLTFTVLSRGSARFQNAFGWYNVRQGMAPDPNDLHVVLDCNAKPGTSKVLDLSAEPAWKGGDVGFFLVSPEDHNQHGTCAGGDCCATVTRANQGQGYAYYSEHDANPDHNPNGSYIHLIIYDSQIAMRKFYFAWEDTFNGMSDDFTDLVTSVSGVECSGAGVACDTGQKGVCGLGVSHCTNGTLACAQLYTSGFERCNGLDDDCDGKIDNGAPCTGDTVCWNGECVPHCAHSEFPCVNQWDCDAPSGLCIDPKCANVPCTGDKLCRGGVCVGPCDGIVCPHGTVCRLGNCLDPCAGVACQNGLVCAEGFCVPGCGQCDGLVCKQGTSCDPSGHCIDPSCANPCPSGTYCSGGKCKDSCDGAVCPEGQSCVKGLCILPSQGGALDAGSGANGRDGGASDLGASTDDAGPLLPADRHPKCDCRVGGRQELGAMELLVFGVVVGLGLRRRHGGWDGSGGR